MTTFRPGHSVAAILIGLGAALIALLGARPYAGGWNDGSRLATVEALVDYGTWRIDDSIFVKVPADTLEKGAPYRAPDLLAGGTRDKLRIAGHFYSDKPPVLALALAAVYKLAQITTGLVAARHPAWFCWLMTFFSSGLAYFASVCCIDRLALLMRLGLRPRLLLAAAFSLATLALPYTRHVNSHAVMLGVSSALILLIASPGPWNAGRLASAGTLLGIGYALDPGAGPVLVICAVALVAFRTRRAGCVILALGAAFPWFVFHHWLNYRIGGGFWPANANPAYLAWPGSPFTPENMTGVWRSRGLLKTSVYALDLLFGRLGFFPYNLPLFLLLPGLPILLRRRVRETPEILAAVCWGAGTWLLYALASNNHAGACLSVRWFVPLLAPAFYLLSLLLREQPQLIRSFAILTAGGVALGALMEWRGPWGNRMLPGFWFVVAPTIIAWLADWNRRRREARFTGESRR
jgi:hypothetical protein